MADHSMTAHTQARTHTRTHARGTHTLPPKRFVPLCACGVEFVAYTLIGIADSDEGDLVGVTEKGYSV